MKRVLPLVARGALWALALSMLVPFLWMLGTALMSGPEVYSVPPRLIPASWRWANFAEALSLQPFGRYFLNSLIISVCSVAGQLLFCSMAAYAFARLRFPGRDRLFGAYLSTMMLPGIITMIPAFLLVTRLGGMNSYWALVTPSLSSVWGIFLLRQFFRTIPRDVEDAARLDGASEWTIFSRIVLPLSKPALATLAIFAFMGSWKDFLWPLVVTNTSSMRTVEVGIAAFSGLYQTDWPHQMAAAVVVMLPVMIVFVAAQRHVMRGVTLGGFR